MTVWCCLLLVVTGCAGSTQISGDVKTQKAGEREVTLLEPEGAAGNYEAVTYRNLYKAEIYPATVDFDTKEYAYSTNQTFASYGTLPGETVQSGSPLIYGDTGDLEKQIEEKVLFDVEFRKYQAQIPQEDTTQTAYDFTITQKK